MKGQQKDQHLLEQTLASEDLFDGKVVHLFRDRVRLPSGKEGMREYVRHSGGVAVLPLTKEGEVLLVRQYRYPIARVLCEIPAGKRDKDESIEEGARRELREETGVTDATLRPLAPCYPTPAYTDEMIHLYLATDLVYGEQSLDEDEFLDVVRVPFDTLCEMVERGEIPDAKTQTAVLQTALLRAKGLL